MITDARNRVLRTLSRYGRLKVSEIVGYTDVTWRHLDRVLPELEKEGLVRSYREANKKIYEITSSGKDVLRSQYEAILSEYRAILGPSKMEERRRLLEEKEQMTTLSQPQLKKQLPLLEVLPKMRTRALKLPRKRSKRKVELK